MFAALGIISTILENVLPLLDAADAAYSRFSSLKAKVDALVAEGRDPTVEEWQELQAETRALTDRLEAANKRLNPED